jgi:hypothetical protein
MAQRNGRPLIDDDGEARTPTREEWAWFVKNSDFDDDMTKVHAFLIRRAEILRAAEALGIPKDVFLPFAPTKPWFEDRIAAAFGPFPKAAGLAAE